jgi:hypothetical protein
MFKSKESRVPKYALEFEDCSLKISTSNFIFLGAQTFAGKYAKMFLLTTMALTKLFAVTEEVGGRRFI